MVVMIIVRLNQVGFVQLIQTTCLNVREMIVENNFGTQLLKNVMMDPQGHHLNLNQETDVQTFVPLSLIINVSMRLENIVSAINAETDFGLKLKNVTMETQMITMVVQMNAISTMAGPVMMDLMNLFSTLPNKMTTQQLD